MGIILNCPCCKQAFDLREARAEQEWREFIELLVSLPNGVQTPLLRYLELFKPAKQATVRSSTLRTLAAELVPMIQAQEIKRNHKTYTVPYARWAGAMDYLCSRQASLALPLKGNGYLLETIASTIERQEAQAETKQHEQLRNMVVRPTATVQIKEPMAVPANTTAPALPSPGKETPTFTPEQRAANMRKLGDMLAGLR